MVVVWLLLCAMSCMVNESSVRRQMDTGRARTQTWTWPILGAVFGLLAVDGAESFVVRLVVIVGAGLGAGTALAARLDLTKAWVSHYPPISLTPGTAAFFGIGTGAASLLLWLGGIGNASPYVPLVAVVPAARWLVWRRREMYHDRYLAVERGLASWFGLPSVEKLSSEASGTVVEPDGSICVQPLPLKVPADIQRYVASVGQAMPDYEVVEADVRHMVLRPVSEAERLRRRNLAESGGLVESMVTAKPGDIPGLILDDSNRVGPGTRAALILGEE